MAKQINQTISTAPDAPTRANPQNFAVKADAFVEHIEGLDTELNAYADDANALATEAETHAAESETAKNGSETAEQGAVDAKNAAEAAANVSLWDSGVIYAEGDAAIGSDGQTYRSLVGSNLGNDPTTDSGANWLQITNTLEFSLRSAAFTADDGERVLADTSGGVWTLTLPGTPGSGDAVQVADAGKTWKANNLTVDGNGNNIEGATALTANVDGGSFMAVYNGTQWVVRDATRN